MHDSNTINNMRRQQLHHNQQVFDNVAQQNTSTAPSLQPTLPVNVPPVPSLPSISQMGKNLLKTAMDTAKNVAAGEAFSVNAEEAEKRLSICKQCEFYINERCSKCGCFMSVKTHLKAASCPVNKW